MLRVDLRELSQGRAVETRGELKQGDPVLEGTEVRLQAPVAVQGRLQAIGEDRFYWQGTARPVVGGECRRGLDPVEAAVQLEIGALVTQGPDAPDYPERYP